MSSPKQGLKSLWANKFTVLTNNNTNTLKMILIFMSEITFTSNVNNLFYYSPKTDYIGQANTYTVLFPVRIQ